MVFKSRYTKTNYPANANRLHRRFAWLPVYIDGDMVWFETYDVLQVYAMELYTTNLSGKDVGFQIFKWVDVSKRIISK